MPEAAMCQAETTITIKLITYLPFAACLALLKLARLHCLTKANRGDVVWSRRAAVSGWGPAASVEWEKQKKRTQKK